jgi:hypothetical protein
VLVYRDGPGLGVGFGVVDGDLDIQVPEVGAAVALGDLAGVGQRAALDVQPSQIAESSGLDHQRVALPVARRVAVPPRVRILGQGPAIGKDLPDACIGFVQDHDHLRSLDHLARLPMVVKLHDPHRQAVRVRIILAVVGDALPVHFRAPGRKRQTIFELRAEIPERAPLGERQEIFVRRRLRLVRAATVPPTVRLFCQMPVRAGLPGRFPRCRQVRFAVGVLGAGALRFGFPSGVLGTPGSGKTATERKARRLTRK